MAKMLHMLQDFKLNWMLKRKIIQPVKTNKKTLTKGGAKEKPKARKGTVMPIQTSRLNNTSKTTTMASIGKKILNLPSRVSRESTSVGSSKRRSMIITP